MADSRKKAKKSSIGRLISSARPVGPVASCRRGFGWSCRTRLWSRIAPTTGTPSSPTSQQRRAPVHEGEHQGDGGRRQREAEIAGEGVEREGAAHEALVDAPGQDRVIGRMDDAVPHAGQDRQRQDHRKGRRQAHRGDGERHQQGAADQEGPRAVAVHPEAHRRLERRRGRAHQRHRQAERGVGHAELLPPGRGTAAAGTACRNATGSARCRSGRRCGCRARGRAARRRGLVRPAWAKAGTGTLAVNAKVVP